MCGARAEFGVDIAGEIRVNFARMMARKDEVVETLVGTVIDLMKAHRIDVYDGFGTLEGRGLVHIRPSRTFPDAAPADIRGKKIIVATGSRSARVAIPGADLPGVVTSRGLLRLTRQPQSLVVVGASVVGLEFASMFSALGTKVTVLGRKTFMKSAEEQLAKRFRALMVKSGMSVTVGVDFKEIVQTAEGRLTVKYEQGGKERAAEGEAVLLSTGRTPYTDGLGLEALGVQKDGARVPVDQYMETKAPDVYAIGDVLGTYMLAHVASYEGEVAVEQHPGSPPGRRLQGGALLHLHDSGGFGRRPYGAGGEGARPGLRGGSVPLHGQRQGPRHGRAGRPDPHDLREGRRWVRR